MPDADFLAWMAGYAEDHGPEGWPAVRMWEITRLVEMNRRLRISQLRRMADSAHFSWHLRYGEAPLRNNRYIRFAAACRAEIERLRGEG